MNRKVLSGVVLAALLAAGLGVLVAADAGAAGGVAGTSGGKTYAVTKHFEIGGEGGWDYITVDAQAQRLYVPHATHVAVLDLETGKAVGDVAETPGVHGVAIVSDQGKGFATNGRDGTVSVFDLKTFKTLAKVKAGKKPDAIVYDPASKQVFAINGTSGGVTVIDPAAVDKEPVTIALEGKLEYAVADGKGHVYVNVEDKSELVSIDSRTMKVDGHWPLAPGAEPTGLAMDPVNRRLFAGCSNEKLIVVDADTGKVVTTVPIGKGVDGVAFDSLAGVIIVPNGQDGTATIVAEKDANTFSVIQTAPTVKGARTVTVDPATHRAFMPSTVDKDGGGKTFGVIVLEPTVLPQ